MFELTLNLVQMSSCIFRLVFSARVVLREHPTASDSVSSRAKKECKSTAQQLEWSPLNLAPGQYWEEWSPREYRKTRSDQETTTSAPQTACHISDT